MSSDWFIEFPACILKSPETKGKENRREEDGCIRTCSQNPAKLRLKDAKREKLSAVKQKGHPRIEPPARTGAKSTLTSQDACVIAL